MPSSAEELERSAYSERKRGNVEAALKLYEEAAALYRAEGNPSKVAHTIRHVADVYRGKGRADLAEPLYNEALSLYRNDPKTGQLELANARRGLAILKSDASDAEAARALWTEARDLYQAVGVQAGVEECNAAQAVLPVSMGPGGPPKLMKARRGADSPVCHADIPVGVASLARLCCGLFDAAASAFLSAQTSEFDS